MTQEIPALPASDQKHWDSWIESTVLNERLEEIRKSVRGIWTDDNYQEPLKWYTPHGPRHFESVERRFLELIPRKCHRRLSEYEKFLLRASAWTHDIGMLKGIFPGDGAKEAADIREVHEKRTERFLAEHHRDAGVQEEDAFALGILARYHRRRHPIVQCPRTTAIPGQPELVRLRMLAAYLRLADALDVDRMRVPTAEYMMMVAYGLPHTSKIHWLRSKFVQKIHPAADERALLIYFIRPELSGSDAQRQQEVLKSVYDQVAWDLREELESVRDVLTETGISFFLRVEAHYINPVLDRRLQTDLQELAEYYFLLDHPSSSGLSQIALQGISRILRSRKGSGWNRDTQKKAKKEVDEFLKEIRVEILRRRRCHRGLYGLVKGLERATNIVELEQMLEQRRDQSEQARVGIEKSARSFLDDWLKSEASKDRTTLHLLLYGYSEQVLATLKGFLTALSTGAVSKTSSKSGDSKDILVRVFVSEGQPKNKTGPRGSVLFHDGIRYANAVVRLGFEEVYVIPDAIALSLLSGFGTAQGFPGVDFVLVGANGFSQDGFLHSAGHAGVVVGASWCKLDAETGQAPQVILAASTDKYSEVGPSLVEEEEDEGTTTSNRGWCFRKAFDREPVRTDIFVSQDPELKDAMSNVPHPVAFYNPREDCIPIRYVSVMVSELGWNANDGSEEWIKNIVS